MRRRELLASLCGILVAWSARPKLAFGQASQKHALVIWVASYPRLTGKEDLHFIASFLEGMSEFGYTEGSNFAFEFIAGSGPSDLARLAEQAIAAQPAVLLAPATLEAVALSRATSKIPIVCPALADAVHLGLINSEARPGRNVTGIEPYIAGLPAKQIDLARELVPRAAKVGLLTNDGDPKGLPQTRELTSVLAEMGLNAVSANADKSTEIGAALERLALEKVDVVVVLQVPPMKSIALTSFHF
jgi:putative ABC transport system substrate-binding protein